MINKKLGRPVTGKETVTIRLIPAARAELNKLARLMGISRSQLVEFLIRSCSKTMTGPPDVS